ncbi:MAG TPA: DUF3108 domain-containing protein [Steroidobacteraceae bacterium]|jgi:hypothetical protein
MRLTPLLPALIATGLLAAGAHAGEAVPEPFKATYAVRYRGIGAGTLTFELKRDPASGHYVYESRPNPSALARLFISRAAVERSVLEIGPDGVRPLEWHLEDGKSGQAKDGWLEFDWDAGRVSGEVEGERVELPTEPGLQDRSSIQIEVTTALLRGEEPGVIPLIDDERIKRYTYTRKENAVLDSKLGKLDAVIYESSREGSSRLSRFWMVPSLGHIPARAEQIRKGKVETVMELVELERASEGAQSR